MKKIRVTIGIPAYNEENSIDKLLNSILRQDKKTFLLEEILVLSDGSTDNTNEMVKNFIKKNEIIKLVIGKKRLGKSSRISILFKKSKSDVLILLDADIVFSGKKCLEQVVKEFISGRNVGLVGFCDRPHKAKGYQEKVITASITLWNEIRESINNGSSIHNMHACAYAVSKNIYKKISIPHDIFNDDEFIFLFAKLLGTKLRHICSARVKYYAPKTFRDFIEQSARFSNSRVKIFEFFGDQAHSEFEFTALIKYTYILKNLLKDPLYMSQALVLHILYRILRKRYLNNYSLGYWNIIKSTKISHLSDLL